MTKPASVAADRLKSAESRNKSAARLRVVNEGGDLYAAASADGLWIKLGFSTRLADRLKAINHEYIGAAPFRLIGSTASTFGVEQQLHRAMQPLHLIRIAAGKELYPASPAVMKIVKAIIAQPTLGWIELDDLFALRRWCRLQARLDENAAVARVAHAPRIAEREEAERRWYQGLLARIARRRAARAA